MNIHIGNLHSNVSEAQLRELFKEYGKVNSVKIIMDMETGQSKGFGFVEMDERTDGIRAVNKLHNLNFMNMYLEVSEANPRPVTKTEWISNAIRNKEKKSSNNNSPRNNNNNSQRN